MHRMVFESFGLRSYRPLLRLPRIALGAAFIVASLATWLLAPGTFATALAQEKEARLIELVSATYIPPKAPNESQLLRMKFDLSPDVPVGMKFLLELVYNGLPVDTQTLELKNQIRQGIVFDWKPQIRLGVDTYQLQAQVLLALQSPDVQKEIKAKPKRFPPEDEPWVTAFPQDKYPIAVGTPEELEAEKRRMCEIYSKLMDDLEASLKAIETDLEAVRKGEKCRKGTALDAPAFEKLVLDWWKKQAAIQKTIAEMAVKEQFIVQKSQKAHFELLELSRMVAKRAKNNGYDEITRQNSAPAIVLRRNPADPATEVFQFANWQYRYTVTNEDLQNRVKTIEKLTCPEEVVQEPPPGQKPAEKPAVKPKEGGKEPGKAEPGKGKAEAPKKP
jgi:hypothetical protein